MAENLSVVIDKSAEVVHPTLEEEAAKYDTPPPPSEERPTWLPEKFKSAEDLAKAYGELEKKMGQKQSTTAPQAEPEAPKADDNSTSKATETNPDTDAEPATESEARKAADQAGLNFDDLSNKYWENGQLDDSDYESLAKIGIPKNLVDQYIAGQEAIMSAAREQVFSRVGGEEAYDALTSWAADNLTPAEIAAYDRAVDSGDMGTVLMAVNGLQARYNAAVGVEPRRAVKGTSAPAGADVYRSIAEMQKDMADPRYKKDSAFRKDVENKLARSNIL